MREEVTSSVARAAIESTESIGALQMLRLNSGWINRPLLSDVWHDSDACCRASCHVRRAALLLSRERRKRMRDEVRQAVMILDTADIGLDDVLTRDDMLTDALVVLRRALSSERLL